MTNAQAKVKVADLEYEALIAIRSIRELAQQFPQVSHTAAHSLTHICTVGQAEQNAANKVASVTKYQRDPEPDGWQGWED